MEVKTTPAYRSIEEIQQRQIGFQPDPEMRPDAAVTLIVPEKPAAAAFRKNQTVAACSIIPFPVNLEIHARIRNPAIRQETADGGIRQG